MANWPPPAGAGTCWMDHDVPSHRSARGDVLSRLSRQDPTAVQAVAEVHDTLEKPPAAAPAGSGTGWMDHEAPSHRSASGPGSPEAMSPNPTAMQLLAEVHDMPSSPLLPRTAGGRMDHEVPFHTSASGAAGGVPAIPAATQEPAEAQDTAARMLSRGRGTLRVRWTDHEVPFHRSARVRVPCGPLVVPTAVHAVLAVHEMPSRVASVPGVTGVCRMDHEVPSQCWISAA